jgi:3-hydroxypropionyl-CoA synthetase (ADP-forming)
MAPPLVMSVPSLSDYGFVQPRGGLARDADEAVALGSQIGYPVALKIVSPDILHKTDIGGVELGLDSEEDVRAAFGRLLTAARAHTPEARLEGLWVEEMVTRGFEIIIGLKRDDQFGPVIMFGLGGIFTELLEDVSFRVLPIDPEDARQMVTETRGARMLQGYRGQPPVATTSVVDLLLAAARLGRDLGDRLDSVDLNPIRVWEGEHRVLDYKVVTRDQRVRPPARAASGTGGGAEPSTGPGSAPLGELGARDADTSHLATFFQPRSVALVGASATRGKIGYAVLDSLAKHQYQGVVFPVNPTKDSLMGLETYPTLSAIPRPVELVVCTIDLAAVPELVRECAARGVHNLVVVSGGGKELGGERAVLEAEIRRLSRDLGVRVIGPNCIGVFDGTTRLDTFFQPQERMTRPPAGPVAMLSQSGTVGIAFLEDAASFGVSKFVSYGNRVDVDEADLLTFLGEDPDTGFIALYVEGFENGRGFLQAAKRVTEYKPVVIFKAGRTPSAARAALTHTGFFAGSYKVVEGAFRQAGLIAVDSYEELVAVSKALALQSRARGNRVAMIGNGIGTTVQALDILAEAGLELAILAQATIDRLSEIYPSFYIVQNPLDVTGSGTSTDYAIGIQALLDDPGVDIVMPWMVFQDAPLGEDIPEKLGRLNRAASKPILGAATGGAFTHGISAEIEAQGVPMFQSVREWVAAARGLASGVRSSQSTRPS